jgi:hypothetical protein
MLVGIKMRYQSVQFCNRRLVTRAENMRLTYDKVIDALVDFNVSKEMISICAYNLEYSKAAGKQYSFLYYWG